MLAYISGDVTHIFDDGLIINHQGMGFRIYLANPNRYRLHQEVTIYTYLYVREDALMLYGFSSMEEHDLFLRLISVKGVGPKSAIALFAHSDANAIINAIENNDVKMLKSLPGIGAKTASQIVLDLKGKLVHVASDNKEETNNELEEALEALGSLGYKNYEINEIKKALIKLDHTTSDVYIKKALLLLANKKGM